MRNSPLFPVSSALAMILPLLGMFSLPACAQPANPAPGAVAVPGTPAHAARQTMLSLSPGLVIERIADAALPGFQEVVVAGQVMYVSNDGRYLMQGKLYDIEQRSELGQSALSAVRKELLAAVPRKDRIVSANTTSAGLRWSIWRFRGWGWIRMITVRWSRCGVRVIAIRR